MLKIEKLEQAYGGSRILRDVSFEVPAGKVTALLGRNGVGKTTLLRCLMGVLPLRSGRILLDGEPIEHLGPAARARRGLAYVPQGREIFPRLTVAENLRMGLAMQPGRTPIPEHLLEMFPVLRSMLHRRGGDLSGGQQQQLAIARALAAKPRLLILDEPTEGIQPSVIEHIGEVLERLAARGDMTILLVEQYYDFARDLADHYVVLSRGEVVARGLAEHMERDGVRERVAI